MEKLAPQATDTPSPSRRAPDPLLDLAHGAASGDPQATRSLLVEVGGPMLRAVRKVLGSRHSDVEDVTQEAMLGLLDALKGFRGECSITHFASQIALRRALHFRRHCLARDKVGAVMSEAIEPGEVPSAITPHELLVAQERRRVVLDLLTEVNPEVGEALALHFMLDFTAGEISQVFHIPENTVWSRLKRGKKVLKEALANDSDLQALLKEGTTP